jgi:hypothetical protein
VLVATAGGDWDLSVLGTVTFNGGANTDTLRINDLADTGADNYSVSAVSSTKSSGGGAISYGTIETYTLDASNDISNVTVNNTFNGNVFVNGNGAADTITVVDNFVGTFVNVDGGAALDRVVVNSDGVGAAGVRFNSTQDLTSLDILAGGTAVMTPGGNKVLFTQALTLASAGKLDLTDEDMILDYTGATQLAIVQALLNTARNGGAWNGNGITSATAGANAAHNTTLGAMESD